MIVPFPHFRRKKRAYDIAIRTNVKRRHQHGANPFLWLYEFEGAIFTIPYV